MGTTKKPDRKPSIKQQRAIDNVVENGGNISKGMRDAGYSIETAKNPSKLTNSRAWREIMEEYLPDETLAKIHEQLLTKQDVIVRNNPTTGKMEVIATGQIDVQAVKAALDMAYKLKGSYAPEKAIVANIIVNADKQKKSNSLIKGILGNRKDS